MFAIKSINRAIIEMTTRCNLRCTYCLKSQPDSDTGIDMPGVLLDRITDFLIAIKCPYACVNGNGETTIYKNWDLYCDRLLDNGISLGIISNFAKVLSEKELSTLSRFTHIEISCDTADPELFRTLRRGNELSNILNNMKKLSALTQNNLRKPAISWSCVVSDLNIFTLQDYFILGIEHGVTSFNLCNLVIYDELENIQMPRHIIDLPEEEFKKATVILNTLISILREKNIDIRMPPSMADSIAKRYKELCNGTAAIDNTNEYNTICHGNQTRNCTEPWYTLNFRPDGSVSPCCFIEKLFTLTPSTTDKELLNASVLCSLREGLYNGELHESCRFCPNAGIVSIDEFRKQVPAGKHRP
jgi:MoaA/NifB/PqqE/SkfB family radical SAM enzyme